MRAGLLAFAIAISLAPRASALDVELDTDTSFQAYEVRALGARAFMARRRLLSRLSLTLTHAFEEPDDEGRALRLSAQAQLRIDQDFGETCLVDRDLCVRAVDATDPGAWQPLAADTTLDVPAVWVELDGLPLGLSARVGRQLLLDSIGFARYDGASARSTPIRWVTIEALGGMLVRGTSIGATPRSDPQGSIRLDTDRDVPWAAPPIDTYLVSAALEGRAGRWIRARLSFRYAWEDDGEVLSRASAAISSSPTDWLTLSASGVLDLLTDEVIDAAAELSVGDRYLMVRAGIDHHEPRFDPGTIWAWFTAAPIDQGHLGVRWNATESVELGGYVRGRRAQLSDGEDIDAGVDGYVRAAWEGFRVGGSGFLWSGSLGPLAGLSLDVSRPFFGWLEIALDVSLWHFDDPNRQDLYGTVVSETLSGTFRLSPESLFFIELTHAASRTVGNRFRGMLALRVDTWR